MSLYFVYWKSLLTEATGQGQPIFTKEVADDIVKLMNKEYMGEILHFVGS